MGPYTPDLRRRPVLTSSASLSTVFPSNLKNHYQQNGLSGQSQSPLAAFSLSTIDNNNQECRSIKCVLVGDAAVGKTSMIVSYTTDGYPREYLPTAFDNYSVLVHVNGQPVKVQLCDTAGQEDFDNLRLLCYPNADVFLLCFSVINPTSFVDVRQRWIPELREYAPQAPVLLVGAESDLRTDIKTLLDLSRHNRTPVSPQEAEQLVKEIGAIGYVECSSLTQFNLKEVFDRAILAALKLTDDPMRSAVQVHNELGARKSLRKLKEKLVNRSSSVDSMKQVRVKKSNSISDGKLKNALSIGRLNQFCNGSTSVVNSDFKRQPRPSYMEAMKSQHGTPLRGMVKRGESLGKQSGSTNEYWTKSPGASAKPPINKTDLSKMKKAWKKLLCVV